MDGLLMDETTLVERLRQGDRAAAQIVIQGHNQMLWRIARGITHDDADAEEAVQNAYVRALTSIGDFRGQSSLATWMSRIVVNEALRRRGQKRHAVDIADVVETLPPDHQGSVTMAPMPDPEAAAARQQIRRLVERAIDALAPPFRVVFMMRIVEQMSIEETAASLDIPVGTAKTRLHRANQQLRATLGAEFAAMFDGAFPFGGSRCERLTQAVLHQLDRSPADSTTPSLLTIDKESTMSARTVLCNTALAMLACAALGTVSVSAQTSPSTTTQPAAKPSDAQIAHIAYTADNIDIKNAELALKKSKNKDVRAFADDMVRDHTAVNDKALALVKQLNVTPEDNATSKALVKQADAERAKLAKLNGAAFNRAYAKNEVAYHKAVNNALETTLIPDAQNPQLKSLLQTGLGIFQGHEQHAEQLVSELK